MRPEGPSPRDLGSVCGRDGPPGRSVLCRRQAPVGWEAVCLRHVAGSPVLLVLIMPLSLP